MLRTLFVLGLVGVGIRYSLQGAFYILLFYLWNAYFRPEQWAWSDIIQQLRLSMTIGVALIIVSAFSSDRFRFSLGPLLMLAFLAQTLLATSMSTVSEVLWPGWIEFAKVVIVSYLIVAFVNTEDRLRLTLIVIGLSLGFEGARQGWAQLVTNPGARNTNEWVMLGDNNGVAIGMLMLFPLLVALAQTTRDQSRYFAWFLSVGVLYRAISTYSRGGFLAASAMAMHYAMRAKRRTLAIVGVAIMAGFIAWVMPDAYWERVNTVRTAADTTEANRIGFWMLGLEMANDYPVTGVGLDAFRYRYDEYDPTYGLHGRQRDIHSSWFGILADTGYPGFVIFLALVASVGFTARRVRRLAATRPDLANLAVYATVTEAQILVFAVGGTFITLQYKEFIWHVFAISMAIDHIVRERIAASTASSAGERGAVNAVALERLRADRAQKDRVEPAAVKAPSTSW